MSKNILMAIAKRDHDFWFVHVAGVKNLFIILYFFGNEINK
jgi:hypothetical protein